MTSDPSPQTAHDTDRPRGILTERNREFIQPPADDPEISERAERKARKSIRERVYNGILDFGFISQLDREERDLIFQKLQNNWVTAGVGVSIHGLFRFLYAGFREQGQKSDFVNSLEEAVEQYEEEEALARGELVDYSATFAVSVDDRTQIEEVHSKYEDDETLSREERQALVNNPKTDVDYLDMVVHQFRQMKMAQPVSELSEPNPERRDEILSRLRDLLGEEKVSTWRGVEELSAEDVSEDELEEIHELYNELRDVVAPLKTDEELRREHEQRLEEFEKRHPVEQFEPADADDWDPAEDERLQRVIALREAGVREEEWLGSFYVPLSERYGLEGYGVHRWVDDEEEWESVKEAAEFDPDEYDLEALSQDLEELREAVKGKEGRERWDAIGEAAEAAPNLLGEGTEA